MTNITRSGFSYSEYFRIPGEHGTYKATFSDHENTDRKYQQETHRRIQIFVKQVNIPGFSTVYDSRKGSGNIKAFRKDFPSGAEALAKRFKANKKRWNEYMDKCREHDESQVA